MEFSRHYVDHPEEHLSVFFSFSVHSLDYGEIYLLFSSHLLGEEKKARTRIFCMF